MSEAPQDAPVGDEPPGWSVIDPEGNVVASGPITIAQAAFLVGEGTAEEEQE